MSRKIDINEKPNNHYILTEMTVIVVKPFIIVTTYGQIIQSKAINFGPKIIKDTKKLTYKIITWKLIGLGLLYISGSFYGCVVELHINKKANWYLTLVY